MFALTEEILNGEFYAMYVCNTGKFQNSGTVVWNGSRITISRDAVRDFGLLLLVKLFFHGSFSRFLNCTSGTKLRNTSQSLHSVNIPSLCFPLSTFITAQKMKFSIKDFFSKCDQIRSFFLIEHSRRLQSRTFAVVSLELLVLNKLTFSDLWKEQKRRTQTTLIRRRPYQWLKTWTSLQAKYQTWTKRGNEKTI